MEKFKLYADKQKKFWNVSDIEAAKFERIDTEREKSEQAWRELAARDAKLVLDGIDLRDDCAILEIGCGVGRIIKELRQQVEFKRIIGLDISEKMIEFAKEYLGHDERIELHVNSGYDLSIIADDSIDFGYSVDVFIHIFDFDIAANYLREVHRILKKGGQFRFNVRRWDPDTAFVSSLGGTFAKWMYKIGLRSAGEHVWTPGEDAEFNGNQYMPHDLKKLVKSTGLQIVSMKTLGPVIWSTLEK